MEYDVLTIIKPVAAGLLLWFCLPHSIVLSGKRNLAKQITGCVRRCSVRFSAALPSMTDNVLILFVGTRLDRLLLIQLQPIV